MKPKDELTNHDKCRYILRKHPGCAKNRARFFWRYIMLFIIKAEMPSVTYNDFELFWNGNEEMRVPRMTGIERALRDVLNEEEFKLPIKNDARRQELSSKFRMEFKK